MIDQSVVEELKFRNRLEDVVSSYVRLERSGQDLRGLCPFHSEKTPSFYVHPSEGYFHCFGCGAGGDVITFVMKAENLSYPDALEFLAQRAGMTLPDDLSSRQGGVSKREVIAMNREAAKFFHKCLMDPKTPEALQYLQKERGFPKSLIQHFGLGYAPPESAALLKHLKKLGYSEAQMLAADLIKESRKNPGRYFDTYCARMMIPMLDVGGNVVAFSGRRMDGEKNMKYVNTGDTPAFKKGKYIFALNFAKDSGKGRLLLCEGQMDVMALHGAGFSEAIATMGTAITPDQARTIKRYADSAVICYDADQAGQAAADKAFALLNEAGVRTRILKVEGAKDPDEYIKIFGKEAFARLLDGSKTQFEFKFAQILTQYSPLSGENALKAAEATVQLISGFPSDVEREIYLGKAAEELKLPPNVLKAEVEKRLRQKQSSRKKEESAAVLRRAQGFSDRINPQTIGNVSAVRAEEAILGILMLRPEVAEKAFRDRAVRPEDFVTDFDRRVFTELRELHLREAPLDPGLLGESFTADEIGRIFEMRRERALLRENGYDVFLQCVEKLRRSRRRSATEDDILSILESKRKKQNAGDSPDREKETERKT